MKKLRMVYWALACLSSINLSAQQIKLNDIQVIGSHNSYKIAIETPLMDYLKNKDAALAGLEYEHSSFTDQLDLGLRSLELDVFHDPMGGHYSNPGGLAIVKAANEMPLPFDIDNTLKRPGLKVFHVQEIDFRSHQLVFKDALLELREWSYANPGHTPIIITMNTKDAKIPQTRDPLPFDAAALAAIDTEIRAVLSDQQLITPDRVRGTFPSLETAVLTNGWPTLESLQGKFLFVLDEGQEKMERYLQRFPQLKGAVLFVNAEEGTPEAAFRIVNDPVANFEKIKSLVHAGYLVRTRADADTKEARQNDYGRFEKAKASGAQIITTDYYLPSTLFDSEYEVHFEGGTFERIKE